MSTLEEHEAEQAEITAACAAGTCDHPECHDEDACRTCGAEYEGFGDGYDGECPDCADTSYNDQPISYKDCEAPALKIGYDNINWPTP